MQMRFNKVVKAFLFFFLFLLLPALPVLLTTPFVMQSLKPIPGLCYVDREFQKIAILSDAISEKFNVPTLFARNVVSLVFDYTKETLLDPLDVLAIIAVESGFKRIPSNSQSYIGLMQVGAFHAKGQNLAEPEANIRTGISLLEEYRDDTQTPEYTFVAYNAGPGAAKRLCKPRQRCETDYTKKITKFREWLKKSSQGLRT